MKRLQKHGLPVWAVLLFAVLLAVAVTLQALCCQPETLRGDPIQFQVQPQLIVLNTLPVLLVLLALTSLLRNVFLGASLTNLLVCGLSIANRIKIQVRDEPVFPRDLGLLKEVGSAMETYEIHYPQLQIALMILTSLLLLFLGCLLVTATFPVRQRRRWPEHLRRWPEHLRRWPEHLRHWSVRLRDWLVLLLGQLVLLLGQLAQHWGRLARRWGRSVQFQDWPVPLQDWLVRLRGWLVRLRGWMVWLWGWLVQFLSWLMRLLGRLMRLLGRLLLHLGRLLLQFGRLLLQFGRLLRRWGWPMRLLGFLVSAGTLLWLLFTVYASNDLYNSFQVSNRNYVPSVFSELGFPYCFCHHFTTYAVDRPQGFQRDQAEAWQDQAAEGTPGSMVHVVMVMNEAFSDITDSPAFSYTADTDPLSTLHALQTDPHALTGHTAVPGFAGGTANTEFDVLTGIQTNALSATTTSAMRVVNRNLDSLFRVFEKDGYRTSYIHPGYDWFYNRENVLRWMGAEETVFSDQMSDVTFKGQWATDDSMAKLIETAVEEAIEREEVLFNYTTTIQNHMSYTDAKYGEDYEFPPAAVSDVSEEVETMLAVYAEGVRDADAMLGRLVKHFSDMDAPILLVFWGDHLPYLGDDHLGYQELGLDVTSDPDGLENLTAYETPYVIWVNDAAAEALDWENAVESLELSEELSAGFLGAAILELTGRDGQDPWFRFLNQLRREAPVVQRETVLLADGTLTRELPADLEDLIAQWRCWGYYKLKYEELPARAESGASG